MSAPSFHPFEVRRIPTMDTPPALRSPPSAAALGLLLAGAGVESAAAGVAPAGAGIEPARAGVEPAAERPPAVPDASVQQADTLPLPRARTAPALDCDVSEWPPEGRISLSGDEPEVLAMRGVGGASDLTARVHVTWTRDTMYVMTDVRDDRVRPGTPGGGDWVRVGVGATTVWIPAPGGEESRANTGPRSIGDRVPARICATGYGWLGEVAVPADRLGGDLQPGDLVGLQVLVEDPDSPGEDGHPPYLRWTEVAVMAAAPSEDATADSVLAELREDVTMEELRARPGTRDTTVRLPGGDTVPAVHVEVDDVPALAFADPRAGDRVTYWLQGGPESAVADVGLYRTVAALHRRLGALQAAEDRRPKSVYPEIRFELLPGVFFRLGDPGVIAGEEGEVPRAALPTDVFVRSGGGG